MLCSYRDVFVYAYLHSGCVASVSIFCLFQWVRILTCGLWMSKTVGKFCLTSQYWQYSVSTILISLPTLKCEEIPHKIPDSCFTPSWEDMATFGLYSYVALILSLLLRLFYSLPTFNLWFLSWRDKTKRLYVEGMHLSCSYFMLGTMLRLLFSLFYLKPSRHIS